MLLDSREADGVRAWPHGAENAEVQAVALASVRVRFVDLYPAEGDDEERRTDAKRKAFKRALDSATRHDLIGSVSFAASAHLAPDSSRIVVRENASLAQDLSSSSPPASALVR